MEVEGGQRCCHFFPTSRSLPFTCVIKAAEAAGKSFSTCWCGVTATLARVWSRDKPLAYLVERDTILPSPPLPGVTTLKRNQHARRAPLSVSD